MPAFTESNKTYEWCSVDGVQVVNHDRWNDALREQETSSLDSYLTLGYHEASVFLEPQGKALPLLLQIDVDSGKWFLPLLLRPIPNSDGLWDATSAYGYGGPVSSGALDLEQVGEKLNAWATENNVVASFIRLHPLLQNAQLMPAQGGLVELGFTVAWNVEKERGDLLPLMHTHHRRAVRKAERAGLEVEIVENPTSLDEFRKLYNETMQRQEAEEFYYFADSYWQALINEKDLPLVLVNGKLDDEVIASLLCFHDGENLHYHLGASADAARSIGASNRCFFMAASWAQAQGFKRFHLGGGYGGGTESPLFIFKHRFDPQSEPLSFHIAKLVHDTKQYQTLAGTDSIEGYFPAWRA